MERSIIDFPCSLFGAVTRDWFIDVRGRSGGDNINGNGQVVYGSQPRWVATLDFNLIKRNRVLVWQAMMAKMRGRVNLLRICVCDPFQPTNGEIGLTASYIAEIEAGIPHSDDAYFDDDAGYTQGPTLAGVATATGATSITVNATPINDALQPGHFFSVDDWLYRVTGISGTMASRTYEFEPPLRRAVTLVSVINLRPQVIVAFDSDAEGRAKLGSGGRVGQVSFSISEWVNR
jgi:hypothetical protein